MSIIMGNEKLKKILIAEDEKAYSRALVFKLQKSGFDAESVSNGEEVLKAVKEGHYDLLLLDLIMPKMDGFTVLKELKNQNISLPTMILSNLGQIEDETRARDLGAIDFLPKSNITIADVITKVEKFLAPI